ncbi:MAG: beta-N-acetylhexosaminidase [Rhodocyclaceae bacterium]|nr:beta-N-acetylhexosaminidase [Rhodocyclaceae bacterium]
MIDIDGPELTAIERDRLRHPLVGGVILFRRNYIEPEQLRHLCGEIHALREPPLLIAVDHEGGRVQRFREGFTALPPMRALGRLSERAADEALTLTHSVGRLLAGELLACGVDLSFTPVLDLDYGLSEVIGDRSFHADPAVVATLAGALIDGLAASGMAAVGKHFPGHGGVAADSHTDVPVDERACALIMARDVEPFRRLAPRLAGIMPAHVIYPQADPAPAGFSRYWLQQVLRGALEFRGVIFSDDLSMAGAGVVGDIFARADAAVAAGCDMVLVCNAPEQAEALLDRWQVEPDAVASARIAALQPRPGGGRAVATGPDTEAVRERLAALWLGRGDGSCGN